MKGDKKSYKKYIYIFIEDEAYCLIGPFYQYMHPCMDYIVERGFQNDEFVFQSS